MNKEMILQCQRLAAVIVAGTAAAWPGCEGARMDSAPAVPSYAQQTQQTLQAQIKEAPALFPGERPVPADVRGVEPVRH